MMHIAPIRQIELAAMLALALRRTLHRQTQEFESPLLQAPSLMPTKISGRDKRKQNKTEQNEEEFLPEASERKSTSSYPIFKPVSSPDFQIVADSVSSGTKRKARPKAFVDGDAVRPLIYYGANYGQQPSEVLKMCQRYIEIAEGRHGM